MKILFLDIDGVLNNDIMYHVQSVRNERPYPLDMFDPLCVDRVNKIVNETGCVIVLSSSWKSHGITAVNNIFKEVGLPNIYDLTPYNILVRNKKGADIKEWLDTHQDLNIEAYAIIDDDYDFLDEQEPYIIRTLEHYGLTDDKMIEVINVLNKA